MVSDFDTRSRNVTAVLGPTNTGKTHLAIETMLSHESGMIGLPLRLLAREVYDRLVAKVGVGTVALITGEEKIKPDSARYWVCTVEAMPRDVTVDFLAVDEIQLSADFERGHVFTDRLLHARGRQQTLLLGAATMRDAISDLVPGANFISRPRLSKLTYAGQKKLTRLPKRTAIVAFSAAEVYAVADLIRKQQGGAAVVIGALSPRTRNAQVALYQSGDVDYLVATDAIGMGLNLDLDHVALAATRKFDGHNHRNLTPDEIAQIAGRAGRYMNDGTFGVTGGADPLDPELVERLENHIFDPVRTLQWRNRAIDFSTLYALRESLRDIPRMQRLARARMADDVAALETLASDRDIADLANNPAAVALLWDVCQIPDYRKISATSHAEMVGQVYKYLRNDDERIPEDWFAKQVAFSDRTDGDIDTLSTRLAHIRTWTFVANRPNWLKDPVHWQDKTREIEDKLSDALHESLTSKFVDRRTSALMKGMRDKDELAADISEDGSVKVENHYVGRLRGFRFVADAASEDGVNQKAARSAAYQVVSRELSMRTRRVVAAKADAFKITRLGKLQWRGDDIAEVTPTDDPLKLSVTLLVDDSISGPDREKLQARLDAAVVELIGERMKPLADLAKAEDVSGLARGIAFRMTENLGILKRDTVADEIKALDQTSRGQLRKYGVRFGAFNIFIPLLLKPAPAELSLSLWCIKQAKAQGLDVATLPEPPRAGLTSVLANPAIPEAFYRAAGYHVCGPRAVRLDILERLADIIRPLLAWRPSKEDGAGAQTPPRGSTGQGGFLVLPEMMSILGCSPDELAEVLRSLGFESEKRLVPPKPKAQPKREKVVQADAKPDPVATDAAAAADGSETTATMAGGELAGDGAITDAEPAHEVAAPSDAGVPTTSTLAATADTETVTTATSTEPDAGVTKAVAPETGATEVVGEVAAEAQSTEAAAEPTLVEEPKYEDVWRPKRPNRERHHRGPRRDGGTAGDRQAGDRAGGDRTGGDRTGDRPRGDGQRWRDRRGPTRPGGADQPAVAAAANGQPAPVGADGEAARGDRGDRGGERRPYEGGRDRRGPSGGARTDGPRADGPRGDGPRPGGGGRPDQGRRDDRGRGGDRGGDRGPPRDRGGDRRDGGGRDNSRGPRVVTAAPANASGGASDSPFAALSALKAQLAAKGKDGG